MLGFDISFSMQSILISANFVSDKHFDWYVTTLSLNKKGLTWNLKFIVYWFTQMPNILEIFNDNIDIPLTKDLVLCNFWSW